MAVVSQVLLTPQWTLPTITNNYHPCLAGRKRGLDGDTDPQKQGQADMYSRGSNKKVKTTDSLSSASDATNTCPAPHEFLSGAGDWVYDPPPVEGIEGVTPPTEPVDVEKVMAILLEALNTQSQRFAASDSPPKSYQYHPTSPLANSSHRAPFVRKSVGGVCRGRHEPGLQRWVLCKNHLQDVRSHHPSIRSSEWIEALHEMGWEHLHPIYSPQSQQSLDVFPNTCDDCDREEHDGGLLDKQEWPSDHAEPEGEDVWDLVISVEERNSPYSVT